MDRRSFFRAFGVAAVAALPTVGALAEVIPEPELNGGGRYTLTFARALRAIEDKIEEVAKELLFEHNDVETRAKFTALIEEEIKNHPVIVNSMVVCDESNNSAEVIEKNEFWGDVYIKEEGNHFVQLNFVAVRTGVAFEEVSGKFG
jgi:hypothetical protein